MLRDTVSPRPFRLHPPLQLSGRTRNVPFPGWMGVHRLLNLEVSAQRIRAVPVAAQKMGVSGSPCKQRAFWRRGCDVFCWWPGSSSCCVGWESSLGSALGRRA